MLAKKHERNFILYNLLQPTNSDPSNNKHYL